MQKKKARKGFLFLRRESVLPPCRAGPVCPAETNAVFCGGTHGSRPTGCGGHTGRTESSAPTHLVIASQSADWLGMTALQRCKAPSVRGLSAQPTGGEKNRGTSLPPSALRAATSLAEGGFGRPPP